MGAKYATNTASGYNSSAPADDGTQSAANLVTWAGIKTKLGDPVKTLAEDINTDLVTAFDYSVRSLNASGNTVAGDHMRCVEIASTVSSAVTVSLGDASTMTNVYRVFIKNSSNMDQTIGRVTGGDTIDGTAGNLNLPAYSGVVLQTNAAASGYVVIASHGFAATQAEQETATSTTAVVTPGRQHFHPSAAKAWGLITHATTVTTSYPSSGVSVTNPVTGRYVVTHGRTMSSANYAVVVTPVKATQCNAYITARDTTSFTVEFNDVNTGLVAVTAFSYLVMGDI